MKTGLLLLYILLNVFKPLLPCLTKAGLLCEDFFITLQYYCSFIFFTRCKFQITCLIFSQSFDSANVLKTNHVCLYRIDYDKYRVKLIFIVNKNEPCDFLRFYILTKL